ncbi:UDP-N-acetylglucosamine transporter slc35b4 [Ceratocystis fimbriata CBS 114723]|uniref:UDP-N-acetylglucosamine transporter slc35b4 n=1 Tax=Ceratocystis fimbriata CBS 114723 TaxID=1035309 RepID=A0A2C5WWY3_9PEZI|nr:UDP-N-acetylglucosamine transporter slc35b4 [Ceratocystis fimbriata CBS 114723]
MSEKTDLDSSDPTLSNSAPVDVAALDEEKKPLIAPKPSEPPTASSEEDRSQDVTIFPTKAESQSGMTTVLVDFLVSSLSVLVIMAFIFGGCCSNVYALESIIKVEPASGTLLTFVQFLFVAVTGYISQFDKSQAPFFLTPNKVPIRRWLVNIVLFFSINVMNNHAFSYDISVPVHIILRSGGSITTITAGYLWGKRYSRIQVAAVLFLTVGVITAAYSDAQSKGKAEGSSGHSEFSMGLVILFVAQVLSAIMGIYTEETYKTYGPQWRENLFYSHVLSLPLFLPFLPSLVDQFSRLANSPPMIFSLPGWLISEASTSSVSALPVTSVSFPSQLVYLVLNVLTQYACIRGVNLLAAVSTALTVTIVLNIRKLVSLLLSIWLFGNRLAVGTLVGAIVVFGSGALYSLDSSGRRAAKPASTVTPVSLPPSQAVQKPTKQAVQKKMA